MRSFDPLRLPYQILSSFYHEPKIRGKLITGLVVYGVLQSILVFTGSWADGTLLLPKGGDGFLEHYGVWAILVSDPILVVLTCWAFSVYKSAIESLPLARSDRAQSELDSISQCHANFLSLESRSVYLYILLVLIACLCWINNLRQTISPEATYGNDVFDSADYTWGFLANKLNLFCSWVLVYPFVSFYILSIGFCINRTLRRLENQNLLKPSVFHPDGCYGLSKLGLLNLALLLPYLIVYLVVFALLLTHDKSYFTVYAALVTLTTCLLLSSYVTISPVSSLGRRASKEISDNLERKLRNDDHLQKRTGNLILFERICFGLSRASPYESWVRNIVNIVRVIPVVLTLTRVIGG